MEGQQVNALSISERYELGAHRYSTRTAEAVDGIDRETGDRVLFWTLRFPLTAEAGERFIQRLEQIDVLGAPVPRFVSWGVEPNGSAYLVTDLSVGEKLVSKRISHENYEQYFLEAVRGVAVIHGRGLTLGDVCEESFVINARGQVMLVACLGPFEMEAKRTALLPVASTLQYLSPEQRSGAPGDFASDVFALGVLGYRIFAGRYPMGDRPPSDILPTEDPLAAAPAPTVANSAAPDWTDDILGRCLETITENRYGDARELVAALEAAIKTGVRPGGTGRWSHRTLMVRPGTEGVIEAPVVRDQEQTARQTGPLKDVKGQVSAARPGRAADKKSSNSAKVVFVLAAGLVLGVLAAGVIFAIKQGSRSSGIDTAEMFGQADFVPPDLQPAIHDLIASGVSEEQGKLALEKIASSENPVAFAVLAALAKSDQLAQFRGPTLEALVNRIRNQGLGRSSDVLKSYFNAYRERGYDPALAPAFVSLIRACDMTLPLNARRDELHKAYPDDKLTTTQLAAALSIDDPEPDNFTPVLRQLLAGGSGGQGLGDRGIGALILSDRSLSIFFDRDAIAMLPRFTPADLSWTMLRLAENDSQVLFDVARETLRRNIVPPYQGVFLKILSQADKFSIPKDVKITLVRASRGEISVSDVGTLASWFDLKAESALLAICALSKDPDVALSAFDTLAGRTLSGEPAASLITWVRDKYWDQRSRLVKATGILGLSDIASDKEVAYAFDALMPYSGSGSLLKFIIKTDDPRLIREALARLSEITPSDELLKLLGHEDKGVRIAAVLGLKGRNEVSVLQGLIRAYERETNDEVREVYRKTHWVVTDQGRADTTKPVRVVVPPPKI